jgi:integrase
MLTVFLGTGLRSDELLSLRLKDVRKGDITVRWQTAKGEKSRVVPALPEVQQAFERAGGVSRADAVLN